MTKKNEPALKLHQPDHRLYTLEVVLFDGPMTDKFVKKNSMVSRTIQIRGDQTLEDFHLAIFEAFGRDDEHLYEFQFGKKPMDPEARRYGLSDDSGMYENDEGRQPAGLVNNTTFDSLSLKVGNRFFYWFDFGDDWWHHIQVNAIDDKIPPGKFPKVTAKVGKSPPQYADE